MRKLLLALGILLVALIAVVVIVARSIDPNDYRDVIAERATRALGRPVRLGSMSLSLFPLPAVEIADVHVGARGKEPELADVERLELRISPWPLLARQVVLRAVRLEGVTVRLPVDAEGFPRAPELGNPAAAAAEPAGHIEGESDGDEGGAGFSIAITRASIERGRFEAGAWRVENVTLDGRLAPDLSAALTVDADVAGIGSLRGVDVEARGLTGDAPEIDAEGDAKDLDLAALDQRLGLGLGLSGRATGPFAVSLRNGEVTGARATLDGRELALHMEGLDLEGNATADVVLGERFAVDLSDASVGDGETVRKPRGELLRASGKLAPGVPPAALREVELLLPDNRLVLDVELTPALRVAVADGALRLEPLERWLVGGGPGLEGTVGLRGVRAAVAPLAVDGTFALDGVELPLEQGRVSLAGLLLGQGSRIAFQNLRATLEGQTAQIEGHYDLASGELHARTHVERAQVQPLVLAFSGRDSLSGLLESDLTLDGPPDIQRIAGSGSLDISPGEIENFSLVRQLLGQLSTLPVLAAQAGGKDLSRYEQERFERLSARYRLAQGVLRFDTLELIYEHAQAQLQGSVRLSDLALDLSGQLAIGPALDGELFGGSGGGKGRVIPIEGIRGTLDSPRLVVDPVVVARLAAGAATSGRLGQRIDEALGEGASDSVRDLLDGVLGGGSARPAPPKDPNAPAPAERADDPVRGVLDLLDRAKQPRSPEGTR